MAAIANLRIDQGTTFSSNITLAGSDGAAWDLTGHTVEAKMAIGYESTKTRIRREKKDCPYRRGW